MKTIFEPRNLRAILGQSAKVEVMNMLANRPKTKILVDGGAKHERSKPCLASYNGFRIRIIDLPVAFRQSAKQRVFGRDLCAPGKNSNRLERPR